MKLPNRPGRLNRVLLFLTGLILLSAGVFELATRFAVIHVVPGHQALTFISNGRPRGWPAYLAVAIAVVAGLAALRWLAAQTGRGPRPASWRLTADPDRGVTTMHADAAAAPLAQDVETFDGVHAAAAWLSGPRHSPALYLRVLTEYDTNLTALRRQISSYALPRLRDALELDHLPAVILIDPVANTPRTQ